MEAKGEFFVVCQSEKSLKEVKIVVREVSRSKNPKLIDEFLEYDSVSYFEYSNNLVCFVFERQKKKEKEVLKVGEEKKPQESKLEERKSLKRKFQCDFCDFDCTVATGNEKKLKKNL